MADHELYDFPGQKTRSRVWRFFGFRKEKDGPPIRNNLDMSKAICKICRKEYKFKGNTTNFNFHLDHEHPETASACGKDIQFTQPTQTQPRIDLFQATERLSTEKQQKIDDALMKLLVGKVLPLSLVDHKYFRDFVGLLNKKYEIPSRKTVTSRLEKKKAEMTLKVKNEMKSLDDIAITHDGWTSANTESYSTITGHFINDKWELRSIVLETKKVEGSHTAENIKGTLLEAQARWNLPTPTGVTDNAANERKAFDLLQWTRFGCYGHRINLIVKHALGIPELTKMVAKGRKLVTYFHQSSSVNDLLMAKQALLLSEELRGHKLIMDCPTRWNSTHAMLERLLEQTPTIMAVISDPECSKAAANTLKNYVYSFEELDLVERVAYVLAPFLKATNSLCADKSPSMQKVIPVVIKLAQLVEINEDDPHQIKQLKGRMGSEIESRTRDKELAVMACVLNPFTKSLDFLSVNERLEGHQLLLKAALGLESKPVLKVKEEPGIVGPQNGSLPPLPVVPDLLKNDTISSEVQRPDLPTLPSLDPLPSQKSEEDVKVLYVRESEPKKPKLHDMDEWLQDVICIGESSKPVSDVIEQEVARYLGASQTDTDLTILQWWKKNGPFYPRLSCLAKKFLAIPASSVSSERVFSLAGHLVSKKRARLSSANIDNMIFLNKNMEYYW